MKNLTTKLVKVMANVKRVAKNGKNAFHNYEYVKEADILEAVRDELVAQNIFIFSSVEMSHKEGDLTSVVMKHTLVDGDSGESFEVKSFGQGADKTGDKGGPKAITSATKYFLMKLLFIPTGDDPEATDETGKRTSGTKTTKPVAAVDTTETKPTFGFSKRPKAVVTAGVEDAGF